MSDDNQACEVPLVEQLRSVPKDYRTSRAIQWSDDGRETGHQYIPVGFMMHRAADEIERLSARPEGGTTALEALHVARQALAQCYDVTEWPADGTTTQDAAIRMADAVLGAQRPQPQWKQADIRERPDAG